MSQHPMMMMMTAMMMLHILHGLPLNGAWLLREIG
jgi:hypothetical protein